VRGGQSLVICRPARPFVPIEACLSVCVAFLIGAERRRVYSGQIAEQRKKPQRPGLPRGAWELAGAHKGQEVCRTVEAGERPVGWAACHDPMDVPHPTCAR
jgi:hypothetical protein